MARSQARIVAATRLSRVIVVAAGLGSRVTQYYSKCQRRKSSTLKLSLNDEDPEKPVLEWAEGLAVGHEEFLVAFKVDASHFKVIRKFRNDTVSKTFAVAQQTAPRDPTRRGA